MVIGRHLEYLPIVLAASAIIAVFTAYGMAVREKHVDSFFPYISDAGARPPESCVFGQFLNFAAVLAFMGMYIHYKQVTLYKDISEMPTVQKINSFSLWLGAFACIGMSMVANFQYVNSPIPHLIGSVMVFGLNMLYCWTQSFVSYKMIPVGLSSMLATVIRTILSFIATVFFIICSVATPYSISQRLSTDKALFKNTTIDDTISQPISSGHWNKSLGGYDYHLASTFSEWLLAFTVLTYSLTYINEFRKVSLCIKMSPKEPAI